jgi:hypothetical protein
VTEDYNSVLEITVSFLGIHKWEPDIYIGFSTALICSVLVSKRRADEALLNKENIAAQTGSDILYSSVFRDQTQILQNPPVFFQT